MSPARGTSAPAQSPESPISPDASAPAAKQIHPQCCRKPPVRVSWKAQRREARKLLPCPDSTLEKRRCKELRPYILRRIKKAPKTEPQREATNPLGKKAVASD